MTSEDSVAPVHQWTHEPVPASVRAALERLARTESVRHIAVMPDVHLAEGVCVGTVVASEGTLLPQAIGGDIGCGMAIMAMEAEADAVDEQAAGNVLERLYRDVPVVRHRRRDASLLPHSLLSGELSAPELSHLRSSEAPLQLGTLGTGNHFLELQSDENGRLWLMVHSGSRGMGQAISSHHWSRAKRSTSGLLLIDAGSPAGVAYLQDLQWAVRYATESRRSMLMRAAESIAHLLASRPLEETYADCVHNYVSTEEHGGSTWFVHRKGAISAKLGEFGIIPGSMGSSSFHVTGRGLALSLESSSHGAGRSMSRSEARRRISPRELMKQARGTWFDHRVARQLCEEAPGAYKDIQTVMRAQKELTCIVRRLQPVLCYKRE